MAMKMKDGKLSTNDKEHMKVFKPHLEKLYNSNRPIYANAAEFIKLRETEHCLSRDIGWHEFLRAITYLKNDKAPGLNGVTPNAFKCMDERNLKTVYKFICDSWDGNEDYKEWHEGQVVLVPKSGDLSNPNKWRGVNLMDVCSKILSRIITSRLYILLEKH